MYALTPIDSDESAKRLQLLQGQLTRNMQHVAGLNPRAFRYDHCPCETFRHLVDFNHPDRAVHNETVARPLTKGILDGNLLSTFAILSIQRQDELTRPLGTDRQTVMRDSLGLSGPW